MNITKRFDFLLSQGKYIYGFVKMELQKEDSNIFIEHSMKLEKQKIIIVFGKMELIKKIFMDNEE